MFRTIFGGLNISILYPAHQSNRRAGYKLPYPQYMQCDQIILVKKIAIYNLFHKNIGIQFVGISNCSLGLVEVRLRFR